MTNNSPDWKPSDHRILIVDDEEIVLVGLRETLARQGYRITTQSSATEALGILANEQFSAIISDHQMPGMTGLEFLSRAKEVQPDTTRILITAVLNLDTVIDAINKGEIFRFIVKPWLREELLVTVKNAVQRCELLRSNRALQAQTQEANAKLTQLNSSLEEQLSRVAEQNRQLATLNQALSTNLERSVELCLHTMATFYPTLGNQARRVQQICRAMGESLGLNAEQRQTLEISAWLHDIGLLGVPRRLIRIWQETPEKLSDAEKALIEQHPIIGQELAGFVHHLSAVGETIRAHHERFDGAGYPDHLQGDQIPWLARLLAVAVAFASSPLPQPDAVEMVKAGSSTAFDPEAVRAMLRVLPTARVPQRQRQVLLSELKPGMILASGIYTAQGLLLLPEGQELTETYIEKLLNHHRVAPITQSLIVYC
jgi:response regulator RpfG family c-di-GMP phosphodiesterase